MLVIPVELLRDNPAQFFDRIEEHAGFTLRPRSPESIQHNRSLTGHELQAMRVLNRLVKVLSADQQGKPEQFPVRSSELGKTQTFYRITLKMTQVLYGVVSACFGLWGLVLISASFQRHSLQSPVRR